MWNYQCFAEICHVQLWNYASFTLLPHFLNHSRLDTKGCFVQIIEKCEKSEVDCRQMMTRPRFSSLLDVIHAFCQYIFLHLYTHI